MKKYLLFGIVCLGTGVLFAQAPIITQSSVGSIGALYVMANDTLPPSGINQGNAGTNQNVDFTTLAWQSLDTVRYLASATTPFGLDFPSSNLAIYSSANAGYFYTINSASSLTAIGLAGDPFGLGTNFILDINPSRMLMPFPFTYGDSYLDTSMIDYKADLSLVAGTDSVRYKNVSYADADADAWGSTTLSSGTYSSLRVKQVTRSIDSVWAHLIFPSSWILIQSTDVTDSTFTFWNDTKGYLLAEVEYSDGVLSNIQYMDPNPVGIDDPLSAKTVQLNIFPNPSDGIVKVQLENLTSGKLDWYDVHGKLLGTEAISGNQLTIDLEGNPSGIYWIKAMNSKGEFVASSKMILAK